MCRQLLTPQSADSARGGLALHQCSERSHLHLQKPPLRVPLMTKSSHLHLKAPRRPTQRLQGLHMVQTAKMQPPPAVQQRRRAEAVSSHANV